MQSFSVCWYILTYRFVLFLVSSEGKREGKRKGNDFELLVKGSARWYLCGIIFRVFWDLILEERDFAKLRF